MNWPSRRELKGLAERKPRNLFLRLTINQANMGAPCSWPTTINAPKDNTQHILKDLASNVRILLICCEKLLFSLELSQNCFHVLFQAFISRVVFHDLHHLTTCVRYCSHSVPPSSQAKSIALRAIIHGLHGLHNSSPSEVMH